MKQQQQQQTYLWSFASKATYSCCYIVVSTCLSPLCPKSATLFSVSLSSMSSSPAIVVSFSCRADCEENIQGRDEKKNESRRDSQVKWNIQPASIWLQCHCHHRAGEPRHGAGHQQHQRVQRCDERKARLFQEQHDGQVPVLLQQHLALGLHNGPGVLGVVVVVVCHKYSKNVTLTQHRIIFNIVSRIGKQIL